MTAEKTTVRVFTADGTNASEIGESYAGYGAAWRSSVDGCDSDGGGRVFLDCDADAVEYVCEQLEGDERVTQYEVSGI